MQQLIMSSWSMQYPNMLLAGLLTAPLQPKRHGAGGHAGILTYFMRNADLHCGPQRRCPVWPLANQPGAVCRYRERTMKNFVAGFLAIGAMVATIMPAPAHAQVSAAPHRRRQRPAQPLKLGDIAPKLADLTDTVLFGDVWARPNFPSGTAAWSL